MKHSKIGAVLPPLERMSAAGVRYHMNEIDITCHMNEIDITCHMNEIDSFHASTAFFRSSTQILYLEY